jgi:hypothetical protein
MEARRSILHVHVSLLYRQPLFRLDIDIDVLVVRQGPNRYLEANGIGFCHQTKSKLFPKTFEWVYNSVSLLVCQLSPRHVLGIPAEQLMRGDELGLAVSVPSLVAGLAAADDLGQLGSGGLVELLGCLQCRGREFGV